MEVFTAIFSDLGVDSSLIPQFLITLFSFIITNLLFLGKLMQVLETREERTTKLESHADEALVKVTKMQNEYNSKISSAYQIALTETNSKKQQINQKYSGHYKSMEKEVGTYVEESRTSIFKEIEENRQLYLSGADNLSQELVEKIIH